MLKKSYQNVFKFLLLFGITIFIYTCQKEDNITSVKKEITLSRKNYTVIPLRKKDIQSNKIILQKLYDISKKRNF